MPLNKNIQKCVAGYDYVLFLASQSLYCYYQSAIYSLSHFKEAIDVATTDNMIVVVTQSGSALIAESLSHEYINNKPLIIILRFSRKAENGNRSEQLLAFSRSRRGSDQGKREMAWRKLKLVEN
jgi:hypothetical protein